MKNMTLMLSRIGSYFRKNKLIFLLFVLGGILNSFVLACFFGEAQKLIHMVAAPEASSYYREYSIQWQPLGTNQTSTTSEAYLGFPNTIGEEVDGVWISNPIEGFGERKLTLKQAKALSESDLIETVSVKYVSRENNSHRNAFAMGENVFTVQALIKGNTPSAGGLNYHQVREPLEFARGNVKYEELKDDEIILDLSHSAKVGDMVTVSGVDFRVVAVASNLPGENNLITARAMEKICGSMLDSIGVVSKEQYNENDNPVTRLFNSIFADYGIAYLDIPYPVPTEIQNSYFLSRPERENVFEMPKEVKQGYTERLVLIFFCYFASQGAFLILLRYLLSSLEEDNAISMIVGMKRSRLSFLILSECLLLSVVSSLFGLVLHKILLPHLFVHINSVYYLTDSFSDYAKLFLLMLGINLVILVPFVILYRAKTPVELRRRGS